MAFNGVQIGVSDGVADHDCFLLGVADGPPLAGCKHPLRPVQKVQLPRNHNHLDAAAGLPEVVPRATVRGLPEVQFFGGSHAGIDLGENGPVLPGGHRQLEMWKYRMRQRGRRRCVSGVAWGRCRAT